MNIKRLFSAIMVIACLAMLSTSCAKKPKLNLANLRDNSQNATGADGFNDAVFNPASSDSPEFTSANGGKDGWGSMDSPIANGNDPAANFIANGVAWEEKVYFDYNRHEIKPSERQKLDRLATQLSSNPAKAVVIEGHCDERGSDEYNRALSEKRAIVIRDYLSNLGVAPERMLTVPCGEDKPEVPNASSEKEHALNRRGQFIIGDKK